MRWLDNDGKPHRVSFHQIADIAPLSTVIITGTIADVGDPRALVIDADSMFLEDRGPFAAMMDKMKEAGTDPYAMSPVSHSKRRPLPVTVPAPLYWALYCRGHSPRPMGPRRARPL